MTPQEKYDRNNTRRYQLKLNLKTDSEIITKLSQVPSMQGYIKSLILADIRQSALANTQLRGKGERAPHNTTS